jgi:hypothetical protein
VLSALRDWDIIISIIQVFNRYSLIRQDGMTRWGGKPHPKSESVVKQKDYS